MPIIYKSSNGLVMITLRGKSFSIETYEKTTSGNYIKTSYSNHKLDDGCVVFGERNVRGIYDPIKDSNPFEYLGNSEKLPLDMAGNPLGEE